MQSVVFVRSGERSNQRTFVQDRRTSCSDAQNSLQEGSGMNSKRKLCADCGSVHQRLVPFCYKCERKHKAENAPEKKCPVCGKTHRCIASEYCSVGCSIDGLFISLKAHREVSKAVKLGEINRLDGQVACVDCGLPATVYEHRDYTKPLDVVPVCKSCNRIRGSAHTYKRAA